MVEQARGVTDPQLHSAGFGARLREWAEADPEAALAYVRQLPAGADYTQGLLQVLEVFGRRDPDRALVLARELVSTGEQQAFYNSFFARLATEDPAAAAARLASLPPGDRRERALRAVAEGWSSTDLPAALAWAGKLDAADRGPALEAVLAVLAPADPLRAINLAGQSLTGVAWERTVGAALRVLVQSDPQAAAAMVSRLPLDGELGPVALEVARALAGRNAAEALAWVNRLSAGKVRDLALTNALDSWAAEDPIAAGRYIARLPAGPTQVAAATGWARRRAVTDPQEAATWSGMLNDDSARRPALAIIASVWAQHDPAAAARWAADTPALPAEALTGALSYWTLQDAGAAQDFVLHLAGETQVRAAVYLAPTLAQRDPVAALTWSQSLPNAAAREAALAAAFARWLGNAPVAARTWVAAANLPPATKARLLAPARP